MNIAKFLRTRIFKNMYERLFLCFRILKKKFMKNEKIANRKLGKMGNLGNLGKIIPSFRFCPIDKIENEDFRFLEKNFRDFQEF